MSHPSRAEIIAELHDCIKQARRARDHKALKSYGNLAAKDDDMELAEHLYKLAANIERDDDWAYDRHVDNLL